MKCLFINFSALKIKTNYHTVILNPFAIYDENGCHCNKEQYFLLGFEISCVWMERD
jgi:hypothetical protein